MPLNYNPFQTGALRFPKKHQADIQNYCQKDSKKSNVLNSPFERIVDLWFLCVCTGVYFEEEKEIKNGYKFMEGSVLKENQKVIETLETIAIAATNDETIVEHPNKMLKILNQYAFAGIERIFDGLSSGHSDSLWNLTDYLSKIIK